MIWLFNHKKLRVQNFIPVFPVISRIFDLECHKQTSLTVVYVMFRLVFVNLRKLKSLHLENKKLDLHKTFHFIVTF